MPFRVVSLESISVLSNFSRVKEGEIENQTKQISQFKKYIGESENIPKPADVARREKETLLAKLKVSNILYLDIYYIQPNSCIVHLDFSELWEKDLQ